MIHIHIDNNHPIDMDIHINISMKNSMNSTQSPIISNRYYNNEKYLYDNQHKKIYTLQQIHENVEMIQKYYEQILDKPISSLSSCFFPFKKMIKIFKIFRTKSTEQTNQLENKSPFIFGGETLQWIALPQYTDHIYENELIN
jgi:hypothetical protein